MKYVLSIDQGTTSSRAVLFNERGELVAMENKPFPQIFPKEGWVEHDPSDILSSVLDTVFKVVENSKINPDDIACIGITNQRETTLVWDKKTGKPVYNAIVWQCRRTAPIIDKLVKDGYKNTVKRKTGLIPDAYFSGSKIKWILDNVKGAREKAERGELAFGTVDSWIIWNLTNGKVHATDKTNASRTMLYNIRTLQWDDNLLKLLGVPKSMLPKVLSSGEFFGNAELFSREIPITGVAGDQQAALFGQGCFEKGEAKNTYGTGCFLLMNVGETLPMSKNGLLTTLVATLKDEKPQYALEGSVFVGGAIVQWLREQMGLIEDSKEIGVLSASVPDTGGVYVVPAFTGLGAPYWDMYARGTVVGLTRGTKREHFLRACNESIAYQSYDLVSAMEKDTGVELTKLKVDGGASRDLFLLSFQADVLKKEVVRPAVLETTALGVAYIAGITAGVWKDKAEVKGLCKADKIFYSTMDESERETLLNGWHKAVKRSRHWSK